MGNLHNSLLDQELDISIEKLVYGGDGLARHDGRVVMAPFVLPEERIRVKVIEERKSFLRALPLEILSASPAREQPLCPYFQRCGGCHYQHMSYAEEREQKLAILREVLKRVGKIDFEGEIPVVFDEPYHYRNRIQLHIENGRVGYFHADSRKLCAIESCPVASPMLNRAIAKLNAALSNLRPYQTTIELFTDESLVQVTAPRRIAEELGDSGRILYNGLAVSPQSFFQVNRLLIPKLVDLAVENAEGSNALDLYAGVGLFSRDLSARCRRVTAVESSDSSDYDSALNAADSPSPWQVYHAPVERFLTTVDNKPDFILADPPRAGLGPSVVQELLRIRAPRLNIVSCDPATLARDLAALRSAYEIRKITLIDLFPRTAHMETVAVLQAV